MHFLSALLLCATGTSALVSPTPTAPPPMAAAPHTQQPRSTSARAWEHHWSGREEGLVHGPNTGVAMTWCPTQGDTTPVTLSFCLHDKQTILFSPHQPRRRRPTRAPAVPPGLSLTSRSTLTATSAHRWAPTVVATAAHRSLPLSEDISCVGHHPAPPSPASVDVRRSLPSPAALPRRSRCSAVEWHIASALHHAMRMFATRLW
ncbi:hypothetical protein DFH06DRAFT_1307885 [Mycena polygramma]|nr:hypothetical protein DFH06DRAFT_1307885 [Mycena polygramma]